MANRLLPSSCDNRAPLYIVDEEQQPAVAAQEHGTLLTALLRGNGENRLEAAAGITTVICLLLKRKNFFRAAVI